MNSEFLRHLVKTAVAAAHKPADALTNDEKVALAWMAGAELETYRDGVAFRVRTKQPVGFMDRGDGTLIIGIGTPSRP